MLKVVLTSLGIAALAFASGCASAPKPLPRATSAINTTSYADLSWRADALRAAANDDEMALPDPETQGPSAHREAAPDTIRPRLATARASN